MGCGSSTSVHPPESTGRSPSNSDPVVPSPEDNHDDTSRDRTRGNTPNTDENRHGDEADKHLQKLEEERKDRNEDKKAQDDKLQKRIEEERKEREEENKLNKKNNKNQDEKEKDKPHPSKIEDVKEEKSDNLKESNDNKTEEEEKEKREEEEKEKSEEDEKQKPEEETEKREEETEKRQEETEKRQEETEKRQEEGKKDQVDNSGLVYHGVPCGLNRHIADFREDGKQPESMVKPSGDDLYTDHEFTLKDALQKDGAGLDWKRPQEFRDAPVLFSEGTTRFDIGQGSAGTCWFLSLVASISERKDLLKQIIPDDAYPSPGSPGYRGMFHCRFWRFGEWQDVYIDDYLPVIYKTQLWGAESATEPNEMWVALLEKAFAKFHGSYLDVYGGQTVDAFLTLTGGVGEMVELKTTTPPELFRRLNNAIRSRAMVTCTVPADKDKVHGLVGAHAYSLTGVTTVPSKGRQIPLVRIRNPWGKCEWTGPWSDRSAEWNGVPKGAVDREKKDDGEFWMALDDFFQYFSNASICSVTPDFDMDGHNDGLEYVTEMLGEWKGKSAAGYKNLMVNPRHLITVPCSGAQDNGLVPLVIQLVQWVEERKEEKLSMRCDLFKVLGEGGCSGKQAFVCEKFGDGDNTYFTTKQQSFRYAVHPGKYIIVPSTFEAGQENDFMIRVFSSCPLEGCGKVDDESASTMSCEIKDKVGDHSLDHCECIFGKWQRGKNSGGQISHDSHCTNPQLSFTVEKDKEAVVINMMQENSLPKLPLGVKVYQLTPDVSLPMTQKYLLKYYEDAPSTIDGEQGRFVISWDANAPYLLSRGQYGVILYTDQPDDGKDIAVVVKSSEKLDIKQFQMS